MKQSRPRRCSDRKARAGSRRRASLVPPRMTPTSSETSGGRDDQRRIRRVARPEEEAVSTGSISRTKLVGPSLRACAPALLSMLLLASPLSAGTKAFSIPVSDGVVLAEVSLPRGGKLEFSRVEGGLVRIEDVGSEVAYGIIANFKGVPAGAVNFLVVEITPSFSGGENVTQIEQFSLARKEVREVPTQIGLLQIRLISRVDGDERPLYLRDGELKLDGQVEATLDDLLQPQCCIICDGYLICGDTVSSDCGTCGGGGLQAK